MDIEQFRRFIAAAEVGNFSQAAKSLRITQSALTQSIKTLENLLGGELFSRGTRGVKLTPFGDMLMPRARLIVAESGRVREDIAAFKQERAARVTVGVAPYLGNSVFPAALEQFVATLPDIRVTIVVEETGDLVALIKAGQVELALCGYNESLADPALRFDETLKQRYVLMARSSHQVFKMRALRDADLAQFRWVTYDHRTVSARMEKFFSDVGVPPPQRITHTNSLAMIRALSLHTDAIVVLPTDFVADELQRGDLRIIPASARFGFDGRAGIVSLRDVPRSRPLQVLAAAITKVCKALRPVRAA